MNTELNGFIPDSEFEKYYRESVVSQLDGLMTLRAREKHKSDILHNQKEIIDAYVHNLTQIVMDYYHETLNADELTFDASAFYDTSLLDYFDELALGEFILGHYGSTKYTALYGILTDTQAGVLGFQPENFQAHVLLYSIEFPESFKNIVLAWHKDWLLDLAEKREHLNLTRVSSAGALWDRLYKIYTKQKDFPKHLLTDSLFHSLEALRLLCDDQPLDFSFEGNKLSIICRKVERPFALTPYDSKDTVDTIKEDLYILKRHIDIIGRLIEELS